MGPIALSQVVVPINAGLLVAVVVFFCLVLLHEAGVSKSAPSRKCQHIMSVGTRIAI